MRQVLDQIKNERNEDLIIYLKTANDRTEPQLDIIVNTENNQKMCEIMTTVRDLPIFNEKHLIIEDILVANKNLGYGSIAMEHLIEVAKEKDFVYIKGALTSVDKDHFDRLIHFYEKFGFEVNINENKDAGSILLKL